MLSFLRPIYRMGIFFGVAKISIIFFVCLIFDIPDIFFGKQ